MTAPLRLMIVLRCLQGTVTATSVADLDAIALQVEMLVAPILAEYLGGIIEVHQVIVDHDPS